MPFKNLVFTKEKTGGAQESGPESGFFKADFDGKSRAFLAKKEPTLGKNACELAASIIANSLHEFVETELRADEKQEGEKTRSELFAVVKPIPATDLHRAKNAKLAPKDRVEKKIDSNDIYVASLFASSNAKDFWEFAYVQYIKNGLFERQRRKNNHSELTLPEKRPKFLGSGEPKIVFDTVMTEIVEGGNKHFLQEFSDARAVNFILKNPDNHFGNLVVSHDGCENFADCKNGKCTLDNVHLHSIDFAGAFDPAYRAFDATLLPLRKGGLAPQPTNHNDEYSRRWKITAEMANACEHYSQALLAKGDEISEKVADEVASSLALDEVEAYARRLMLAFPDYQVSFERELQEKDNSNKLEFFKKTIANLLREDFKRRAIPQCEQEAFEIRLSLCFDPIKPNHPELGFKANLPAMIAFFKTQDLKTLDARIKKSKFRRIGQEDYLKPLQAITLDVLAKVRHSNLDKKDEIREILKNSHKKTDSLISLRKRLRNAVFDIYELSPQSSLWARVRRVAGWPDKLSAPLKPFYFLLMLPRTLLKLGFELLPAVGGEFLGWAHDRSLRFLWDKNKKVDGIVSLGAHTLAAIGYVLAGLGSVSCNVVRQVGMRISAPIRSVKEAHHVGNQLGNKIGGEFFGYLFGTIGAVASMAVSVVGIMTTAVLAAPLVAAGLGAIGLQGVALSMTGVATAAAHLHVVSTVVGLTGMIGGKVLGAVAGLTALLGVAGKGIYLAGKAFFRKLEKSEQNEITPLASVEMDSSDAKRESTTGGLMGGRYKVAIKSSVETKDHSVDASRDESVQSSSKSVKITAPEHQETATFAPRSSV